MKLSGKILLTGMFRRGVALVAVLAILTVLSIMAAAFAYYMHTERQLGMISGSKVQSDLLAQSALEHALSVLRRDVQESPGWDDFSEYWCSHFLPRNTNDSVDIDGLPSVVANAGNMDGRWLYVRDSNNEVIGRYAVKIEDEAGKLNINAAAAYSDAMQNQGIDTFELLITDGKSRGLPISLALAKRLLEHRYGRDHSPGQAGVDDNLTASTYASDEIDNDGDSAFDEAEEGIDEPVEYTASNPRWDDRSFSSLEEVIDMADPKRSIPLKAARLLQRYGTVHSSNRDLFFDEREGYLRKQLNLNVSTKYQLRRILKRANEESRFESSSRNMHSLIANLMDYRDENHVLTTVESAYGVESVCFNEIMAHDASFIREADWADWWPFLPNLRDRILCYNRFYGHWLDNGQSDDYKWRLSSVRSSGNSGGNQLVQIRLNLPKKTTGGGNFFQLFSDFLKCDTSWPQNLWKNGTAVIFNGTYVKEFPIDSNPRTSQREVVIRCRPSDFPDIMNAYSNSNSRILLRNNWRHGGSMWCEKPESTDTYFVRSPNVKQEEFYYLVYIMNTSLDYLTKTLNRELDVDGDPAHYSAQQELRSDNGNYNLKYPYTKGKAIRANSVGYVPLTITSSRKCAKGRWVNYADRIVFLRPDIVELINISDQPVSLRNWRVVVNTGIRADTLATIDNSVYYSPRRNGRYVNPHPYIAPGGHFYLTNNREIFDIDHCDGSRVYGDSQREVNQVFELPEANWGIIYDVVYTDHDYIKVTGSNWDEDQMEGEMVEFIVDRAPSLSRDVPNGMYNLVYGNTKDTLYVMGQDPRATGLLEGDKVRIRGLPRQGGFVSFTLKNEYNQLTARTTEYGSVDVEEYGYSTEKYDPSHYTWVKIRKPTMGGLPSEANSRLMRGNNYVGAHVKNNRLATVAEIQKVRKAGDWENIGEMRGGKSNIEVLKAVAKYFSVSGVRLDPEEENVHLEGWKSAFGKTEQCNNQTIATSGVNWEPALWSNQTLRILSGDMKGEEFYVISSQNNSLQVDGYSIPGHQQLRAKRGDLFCVGPGYSTPMFYSRHDNEEGIWEWKDKDLKKQTYGLYLFGLSDSIDTTEFLEENFNAELEVAVFNFVSRKFDILPLADDRKSSRSTDDAYKIVQGISRHTFDKTDGTYCGTIHPDHISPNGGIKVRLIPHGLQKQGCSGFAWFDYAFLSPAGSDGKINVNTATERIMASLKGVNPILAENLVSGIDASGKPLLKPYKNISDVLDVRGMTPELFQSICNLITTRSDHFRIQVVAQSLKDPASKGKYSVLSKSRIDVIVDRTELSDDDPDTARFSIISRR